MKLSPAVGIAFDTDTAAAAPPLATTLFTTSSRALRVSSGESALSIVPRPLIVACHSSSIADGLRAMLRESFMSQSGRLVYGSAFWFGYAEFANIHPDSPSTRP